MIKSFIKTKKFLCSVSFIISVGTGYVLGIFNFRLEGLDIFLNTLKKIVLSFSSFTPTPNFLSDVAAFEAVIIALAIPLSFEIVSRISERYKSEVITKKFIQEWEIKWLPIFLVLAVTLRFFINDNPNSALWKVLAWTTFAGFLFVAIILFKFLAGLKLYMTDTESILNKLFDEAEKLFTNNKELILKQERFIQSLEGIGDILVFETKRRNRNKNVIQGLKRIENIIKDFFAIQKNDPDKFERLLLAQEFFELYKKDEKEAKFRLAFDPDKYLISFSTAINQILRIHEVAIEVKNDEISRFATYNLNWLLADITQTPNNDLFVEQLLKYLAGVTRLAIENQDRSMYAASIHWYIDIVFNKLRQKEGSFDLSYLELFDKYFFASVKYIVSENQTSLFNALVSSLIDGVYIQDYHRGEVWNYGHVILHEDLQKYNQLDAKYSIERLVRELADSENDLYTKEKLEAWLKKFNELKAIIEPNLNEEQKKEAHKIEEKIRDFAISQFKYQNLLEIVFAIGAYCLFKQRYSYIKYLWEYKQPPDSDASWIGHDITPRTLDEIIQFYFRKGLFERRFDFWEGHHGSEKYYKQYFLLLLSRVLQSVPADEEGRYPQIENYKLPDLHIYRLSDIEHSIDDFISLATDLKQDINMLTEIGLDTTKLNEIFDAKLVPFLKKIKEEATKQISAKHKLGNISQKKVEEFKREVLKSFYESANLREIFTKYFKAYEDKTKERILSKKERFGINIVDDKASFFDEWHVHYVGWGENYGRNLASGENSYLLDEIAKGCKEISKEDFEEILSKFKNPKDIVIFATNITFWRFFENSKSFKPKWYRDVKQLEVKGFGGWYDFNGQLIPVFETYHRKIEKQVLILNKNKIGKLIQLSPLNKGEDKNLVKDIFYINVQAFSENNNLMEQFIKKPPEWLKKIGNEQKQREHLQERVLIHIFERFEYNKPKDFEGYKFLLKE